jgi:hypothetical protein
MQSQGMLMRRAAKIDANQPQIVEALRKAGATVHSLAAVGNGIPDLLVGAMRKPNVILRKTWLKAFRESMSGTGVRIPSPEAA